jgi:hypothetical protein
MDGVMIEWVREVGKSEVAGRRGSVMLANLEKGGRRDV